MNTRTEINFPGSNSSFSNGQAANNPRFPYFQYMYSYPHKTAYRELPNLPVKDYLDGGQETLSLYLHLPFCESKCGYCNLFSVTGQTEDTIDQYLAAMKRQLLQYQTLAKKQLSFDSLTIGGGTPLLLSCRQLEELFSLFEPSCCHETCLTVPDSQFSSAKHSEASASGNEDFFQKPSSGLTEVSIEKHPPILIETSPRQTTEEKLALLKQHGVSRISIGVQSFHDEELSLLNRQHTAKECRYALSLIKDAGFECRNLDLIYGIPGQSEASLRSSIEEALSYAPEELFLYPLYIKQGTGLFAKKMQTSEQSYDLYLFASRFLREHGYRQISMRRFVKFQKKDPLFSEQPSFPEIASSENMPFPNCHVQEQTLHSCGFEEMLSLGCGGRSYLKNLHFCTPYHVLPSYCRKEIEHFNKQKDFGTVSFGYLLDGDEMLRRFVIKNLLHLNGFHAEDYRTAKRICTAYGYRDFQEDNDIRADFPFMEALEKEQLLHLEHGNICLTEKGLSYSDWIGTLFISKKVQKKMEHWSDRKNTGSNKKY